MHCVLRKHSAIAFVLPSLYVITLCGGLLL